MKRNERAKSWRQVMSAMSVAVIVGLLLFSSFASAAPPLRVSEVDKRRKEFWSSFAPRLLEALGRRRAEYLKFNDRRSDANLATADDGLRALSAAIQQIESDAAAAVISAASASNNAVDALTTAYLDAVNDACALEDECLGSGIVGGVGLRDQRPVFAREALEVRIAAIRAEFAKFTDAATTLKTKGLAAAERRDGERDWRRRVAVADALRTLPPAAAADALHGMASSKSFPVRVAALEALISFGGDVGVAALASSVTDESQIVAYAGMEAAAGGLGGDSRAAAVLVGYLELQHDAEPRRRAAAALARVSGCPPSLDAAVWREVIAKWDSRAAGRPNAAPGETAPQRAIRPYGLTIATGRVVFVAEWSYRMTMPCRVSLASTRSTTDWFGMERSWERECPSQLMTIRKELNQAIADGGPDLKFGIVRLLDGVRDGWPKMPAASILGLNGLIQANARGRSAAAAFLAAVEPGWSLWHDPVSGILQAYQMAGVGAGDPVAQSARADSIVLVSDGLMKGGWFLLPEHEIAFVRRAHRMRRIPVHVVRIGDAGPSAKAVMEGLAASTGGEYRYATFDP